MHLVGCRCEHMQHVAELLEVPVVASLFLEIVRESRAAQVGARRASRDHDFQVAFAGTADGLLQRDQSPLRVQWSSKSTISNFAAPNKPPWVLLSSAAACTWRDTDAPCNALGPFTGARRAIRTAGLKMREDNSRRFDSGPAWPRAIFRRRGMLRAAHPRAPGRRAV